MIRGYPGRPSVLPGERLVLHVSTSSARFRIRFHRWANGLEFLTETGWLPGKKVADGASDHDWLWPAYEFSVPIEWSSGVYIAHLVEHESAPLTLALDQAAALFVVRGWAQSPLLYKLPIATYHAYNCMGGGCFYHRPARSDDPPGSRVTLQRPGGGIGGETYGAVDYYDHSSARQTFAHWDARFIRWLIRHNYKPEFCTDLDLHAEPDLLHRYNVLLSVGHDEYWSGCMRDAVESFIDKGGNVAFFGANICWWRVHLVDQLSAIVCHQGGPAGAYDHWWPTTGVGRPEDSLSGLSYRHGGGAWDGPRQTRGYLIQVSDHWVFDGTDLRIGSSLGQSTSPPLVGYECDGAPLCWTDEANGLASLLPNAQTYGTPRSLQVLAVGPLNADWQELPPREGFANGQGLHSATMSLYERNGTVFSCGSADWAQVLASSQDSRVDRITLNVIERLLQRRTDRSPAVKSPER